MSFKKYFTEDSFQPQKELNPVFWNEDKELDNDIRERLLLIADAFIKTLKVKAEPEDIIFTGSMANYNWTEQSDVDLHVVYNFSDIDKNDEELVKEFMTAKKGAWNNKHKITIKGFPVELYSQDASEPHFSHGIYSLLNDKWLTEPEPSNEKVDKEVVEVKAEPYREEVNTAIEDDDFNKLEKIIEKLKVYRTAGLKKGGEYSIENLVFKTLRSDGTIQKLMDAKLELFDKQLTLNDSLTEEDMSSMREKHDKDVNELLGDK